MTQSLYFAGQRSGVPAAPLLHGRPGEGENAAAGRHSAPRRPAHPRDSGHTQERLRGPSVNKLKNACGALR